MERMQSTRKAGPGNLIVRDHHDARRPRRHRISESRSVDFPGPLQREASTMFKAKAYSAASATSPLVSATIPRRDPTDHDVRIEILFCGVCHSDLHQVRDEWSGAMPTVYPVVPGHEIVGRVQGWLRSQEIQTRRPRRGRLHG